MDREKQFAGLATKGFSNKEIGSELGLSNRAVENNRELPNGSWGLTGFPSSGDSLKP